MNLNNPIWNQFEPLWSVVNRAIYKRTLVAVGLTPLYNNWTVEPCILVYWLSPNDCVYVLMTSLRSLIPRNVTYQTHLMLVAVQTAVHTSDKFNYTPFGKYSRITTHSRLLPGFTKINGEFNISRFGIKILPPKKELMYILEYVEIVVEYNDRN